MMYREDCERCEQPLDWADEKRRTGRKPPLHHNHTTGKIYGFTHGHCNPRALEIEVDSLKEEIVRLKTELHRAAIAA